MDLIERGPVTVVGIAVEARWDELATAVPDGWRRLWASAARLPRSNAFVELSIGLDGGRYREILGVEVESGAAAPQGFERAELPPARYAHARYEGPLEGIAAAFGALQAELAAVGVGHDEVLLDSGYLAEGVGPHDLYVRVASSART